MGTNAASRMVEKDEVLKKTRLILETALNNVCEKGISHFSGVPLIRWRIRSGSTIVDLLDSHPGRLDQQLTVLIKIRLEGNLYEVISSQRGRDTVLDLFLEEFRRLSSGEKMDMYKADSVVICTLPCSSKHLPETDPLKVIQRLSQDSAVDSLINLAASRMIGLKLLEDNVLSLRGRDTSGNRLWEIHDKVLASVSQFDEAYKESTDGAAGLTEEQKLQLAISNSKTSKSILIIKRDRDRIQMYANTPTGKMLSLFIEHAIREGMMGALRRDQNG
ncbi:MAG: hypothetical protein KGH54_03660 [Candidatus Micrarchaeota archaeon]|nr:hypothetical protein [Candidatus Micrarchaeota archaeon]